MNAIQQKCRPKHQVLVLKCYPRTSKGAVDVKPNSSELSYLLFYATSRRSKIQKIGAFLEKKTASDVWRLRIGNVQVTLGILTALIEKSPKDIALIAPCVLNILELILRSNDISMIESSLPTFDAFCEHHDVSSLFADQSYLHQYESVVRSYASLASISFNPTKQPLSSPVKARWRTAGLKAIRSIAASDALSTLTGRQIDVIVPLILENLWTTDENMLETFLDRVQAEEKADTEKILRRRTSVATVETVDTAGEPRPIAFSGTANDADRLAEEDIGVLAMQCLKSIFVVPNRSQINAATSVLLRFILDRSDAGYSVATLGSKGKNDNGWALTLYNVIARWAPVQDRYIILVVAIDTLIRTPATDARMEQQLVLVSIIGSLLRSDVNLIGLSIMDVLLGLVKQIRKLFRPSGSVNPTDSAADEKTESDTEPSTPLPRKQLLERLEGCIGDLATHVYYADQITDMIAAIIARLKPSRSSSTGSTPHGEKADGNEPLPASSAQDLTESQSTIDAYFSYSKGRLSGLSIIKAILLVANPSLKISGNVNLSRNRVPLDVWEGTHWFLRDPDGEVRKAYVEAFVTWLDRETTAADLRASDEALVQHRPQHKSSQDSPTATASQRAVSNASNRERLPRWRRSQFLPLLHLSIYDNALQYVDYETDLVLLHVLLTKLTFQLGVNAVRYGLPMIYHLQEEIQEIEPPVHKVRIAALCHGYFWALIEKFDIETSALGRAIHNEVARRRTKGFWVSGINVPAPLPRSVGVPGQTGPPPSWDAAALEQEALLPFDDRGALINSIAASYEESARSPPTSPMASPSRAGTGPVLGSTLTSPHEHALEFPDAFREYMLADWTREGVASALALEGKAESLNGSRTGTTTTRNRLTINTANFGSNGIPTHGGSHNLRPQSARLPGDGERFGSSARFSKTSVRSGLSPSPSTTAKGAVASVDQLKMVLSGSLATQNVNGAGEDDEESDDSMVSYEYSASELSHNQGTQVSDRGSVVVDGVKRSASGAHRGPLNSNPPTYNLPNFGDDVGSGDDVPPVPPLPKSHSALTGKSMSAADDIAVQDYAVKGARRNLSNRSRRGSVKSRYGKDDSGKAIDLQELLRGIDSRVGEAGLGNITKPPY
ncbi:unnamed protein product [Clonostachys chloroleuca]|uniref:Protein EFR3 n=1 Tax=Clonostachys chloroleuca TaxID=1926264 RepID=A0AA35MBR6_9HYPO|nr:unnamed protein product [Clonostachys chloroleuca]